MFYCANFWLVAKPKWGVPLKPLFMVLILGIDRFIATPTRRRTFYAKKRKEERRKILHSCLFMRFSWVFFNDFQTMIYHYYYYFLLWKIFETMTHKHNYCICIHKFTCFYISKLGKVPGSPSRSKFSSLGCLAPSIGRLTSWLLCCNLYCLVGSFQNLQLLREVESAASEAEVRYSNFYNP